jgi:hypothetical protein
MKPYSFNVVICAFEFETSVRKRGKRTKKTMDIVTALQSPISNLCQTTISQPTTHPLCQGHLGIMRRDMPQLSAFTKPHSIARRLQEMGILPTTKDGGVDVSPLFLAMLKKKGVDIQPPELIASGTLRVTQSDIVPSIVRQLVKTFKQNPTWQLDLIQECQESQSERTEGTGREAKIHSRFIPGPILVSDDLHILDGHHTASAVMAASYPSGSSLICVQKIPMRMTDLLREANRFVDAIGMVREKGIAQSSLSRTKIDKVSTRNTGLE